MTKSLTSKLDALKEVAEKATQVVSWYVHGYDGTVRGPFGRWFNCLGPEEAKDGKQRQGSMLEDMEFCASAMNNHAALIEALRTAVEALEQEHSGEDYERECYLCQALQKIEGLL